MKPFIWKGMKVGFLNWENHFIKPSILYRAWNSIGIEDEILNELLRLGIHTIKLHLKNSDGSEEWFKTSVDQFLTSPRTMAYKGKLQRHLTLHELRDNYQYKSQKISPNKLTHYSSRPE